MRLELNEVEKTYNSKVLKFQALKGVDLTIEEGELVAIVGPSGSGKSTLLNMITGIDRPTKGEVRADGRRIDNLKEDELARWRGENVGIVFQFFQLFPTLTALENAMLPMDLVQRGTLEERMEKAKGSLELVGLGSKLESLPRALSGGEQQRVAIARALANDPAMIVGDEPTGNLDSATAEKMFQLLCGLNDAGKTVLFVTHDRELARKARRVITIRDGRIVAG
jgi:putative ABC transport system ATP-binding protein